MAGKPEVWLRGPLSNMPALLQPVAHALLQAREELDKLMVNFPENLLWEKPFGMASVGFHLQHLTGVINRLFTYANGKQLDERQLTYLEAEGKPVSGLVVTQLMDIFHNQVDAALIQLLETSELHLTDVRLVGRKNTPSTVIGLHVHAAEHTMRHLGQLLVTVRLLTAAN